MAYTKRFAQSFLILIVAVTAAVAQSSNPKPGITVEAVPACVAGNMPVTIGGSATLPGGEKAVTLTIALQGGSPVAKLAAPLRANGAYVANYAIPSLGSYVVTASGPQKTPVANASFQAVQPPAIKVEVSPASITSTPQSCSSSSLPQAQVTITGQTDIVCGERTVRLVLTPPAPAPPQSFTVEADAQGNFSLRQEAPSSPELIGYRLLHRADKPSQKRHSRSRGPSRTKAIPSTWRSCLHHRDRAMK